MAVGTFFSLCSPDCPKQPRTSFPFYKLFYPIVSAKVSGFMLQLLNVIEFIQLIFPQSASVRKLKVSLQLNGLKSVQTQSGLRILESLSYTKIESINRQAEWRVLNSTSRFLISDLFSRALILENQPRTSNAQN